MGDCIEQFVGEAFHLPQVYVGLVVEASQMQQAVDEESSQLSIARRAEFVSLHPGSIERDVDLSRRHVLADQDVVASDGLLSILDEREGQHIGGLVAPPKRPIQPVHFIVASKDDVDESPRGMTGQRPAGRLLQPVKAGLVESVRQIGTAV